MNHAIQNATRPSQIAVMEIGLVFWILFGYYMSYGGFWGARSNQIQPNPGTSLNEADPSGFPYPEQCDIIVRHGCIKLGLQEIGLSLVYLNDVGDLFMNY